MSHVPWQTALQSNLIVHLEGRDLNWKGQAVGRSWQGGRYDGHAGDCNF